MYERGGRHAEEPSRGGGTPDGGTPGARAGLPEPPPPVPGAPGVPLATSLERLLGSDPDDASVVRAMQAASRLVNHYQSVVASLAVRVAGADPGEWDLGREEVAAALRVTPTAAHRMLEAGRAMADRCPRTAEVLAAGETTYYHLLRLVEGCKELDDAAAARVDALVAPRAATLTVGRFAKAVETLAMAVDPGGAQARHEAALAHDVDVALYDEGNGIATVAATMSAPDARNLYHELVSRSGKSSATDQRTLGQRRVDALLLLVEDGLQAPERPTAPRRRARPLRADVVVNLEMLLGLSDYPGEIPGYGPIPAGLAAALAADARWQLLVVNTASRCLDGLSTDTYQPTERIRRFVEARDGTCRMVTCSQPAYVCDKDHVLPWPQGPTDVTNLADECKRHHLGCKHNGGWTCVQQPDGTLTWTTPLGFSYAVAPHRYGHDADLEAPPGRALDPPEPPAD